MAEVSIADVVLRSVRHCEAGAKSSATVLWIDDDWWIVSVEPSCRNRLYRPAEVVGWRRRSDEA